MLLTNPFCDCLCRDENDEKNDDYEVAEDKIFKAVENAEKKVLSAAHKAEQAVEKAIEDEVETIYHEMPHHEKKEHD